MSLGLVQERDVVLMSDEKTGARAQLTVILPPDVLDWLKAEAERKGVKPSTLLRMWVLERRAEQEREQARTYRSLDHGEHAAGASTQLQP